MANFYGKLTVGQIYSLLETHDFPASPRKYWLLYEYGTVYHDKEQAARAATEEVEPKGLDGRMVYVTGEIVAEGGLYINMTDIKAADREMALAFFTSTRRLPSVKSAKKKATKKSTRT